MNKSFQGVRTGRQALGRWHDPKCAARESVGLLPRKRRERVIGILMGLCPIPFALTLVFLLDKLLLAGGEGLPGVGHVSVQIRLVCGEIGLSRGFGE